MTIISRILKLIQVKKLERIENSSSGLEITSDDVNKSIIGTNFSKTDNLNIAKPFLENIDDIYDCYAFIGNAPSEQDKIFHFNQQYNIFELFNPFVNKWQYKKFYVHQYFEFLLKISKDGVHHTTFKNAPTGGTKNWDKKIFIKLQPNI